MCIYIGVEIEQFSNDFVYLRPGVSVRDTATVSQVTRVVNTETARAVWPERAFTTRATRRSGVADMGRK